jgi:hypothetical protein
MAKKKNIKKRINTFNNWLLARDSSSRISTFPEYTSFLEKLEESKTRFQIMDMFDLITESTPFKNFFKFFDYGIYKMAADKKMKISIYPVDYRSDFKDSIYFLGIKDVKLKKLMVFEVIEGEDEVTESEAAITVLLNEDTTKTYEIIKQAFTLWINSIDLGGDYRERFFKWWFNKCVLETKRYEAGPYEFVTGLIEWMRVADVEDIKKAYLEVRNNIDSGEYTGITNTKELLDRLKWGIKEFNIKGLSDLEKGSDFMSRFF